MSILLVGATSLSAEPGPFERFFRTMRHAFTEPQQKGNAHSNKQRSKSETTATNATPTPSLVESSGVSAPPNERNTKAATRAVSKKGDDFRYGMPVPGKKGFVTSPYSPDSGYIDVRGFQPGTPVKDPYSGKIILTP
jgi:hypothetical protein